MSNQRNTNSIKKLKDALIELLLERNYTDISVSNIAKRAQVSRGTFYQHFLDKDDLANTIGEETSQKFRDILSKGNLDKKEKILEAMEHIKMDFKHFKAISQAPHVQFSNNVRKLLENIITNNTMLKNKIKEYTKVPDDIIIQAFCASFERVISSWIEDDLSDDPKDITDTLIKIERLFW